MFDELRTRNEAYAPTHEAVPLGPALGMVVVTCVDTRIDTAEALGVGAGDAFVIRTVGGRVAGAVNDLHAIAARAGRPLPVMVVHHTNCGTRRLAEELTGQVADATGQAPDEVVAVAVTDPRESVAHDVEVLRRTFDAPAGGYVFDVETGRLDEVVSPS